MKTKIHFIFKVHTEVMLPSINQGSREEFLFFFRRSGGLEKDRDANTFYRNTFYKWRENTAVIKISILHNPLTVNVPLT